MNSSLLVLLVLVFLLVLTENLKAKCLLKMPDVTPKRHLYYNGSSHPITIETSDRPSHQLVSRILRTLLVDVLGYSDVRIRDGYNALNATKTLQRLSGFGSGVPETMVNMEVWIPTGYNTEVWMNEGYLVNGGPLGPSGRFGWYVPSYVTNSMWSESQVLVDHWKTLQLEDISSLFSLHSDLKLLRNFLTRKDPESNRSFCDDGYAGCRSGFLTAPKCHPRNMHGKCAVLLASYPDLDGGLLSNQVRSLDLLVNVAWVGPHLNEFVVNRVANSHPVLFFNWIPNDLTAAGNFSRIHLPMCRASVDSPVDCDFEVNQLAKIVWSMMKSHAPEAYHVIQRVSFGQDQYDEILRDFFRRNGAENITRDEALEQTSCDWLQQNQEIWSKWIPKTTGSKMPIYIGGLFPITGPFWRQPGIVTGAEMAVAKINSDPMILPDHELVLLKEDTQCTVDIAMKHFVQFVGNKTHPIVGILGPGCSETAEPIAAISKHFNTIVISYGAESLHLTNRAMFPLFFRTVPYVMQFSVVYENLFKRWNWRQVALLAEDGQNFPENHAFLKDYFLSHSIQVVYDRKMPRITPPEEASKYIDELKRREVKIIILMSFEKAARAVLCEAYHRGLTAHGGYVWFLPPWFPDQWWLTDDTKKHAGEKIPCTNEQMKSAIDGHFLLNTASLGPSDSQIVGNLTVKEWVKQYYERLNTTVPSTEYSPYGSYAYDAVMVMALGLDKLLSSDPAALESIRSDRTLQKFMRYLNETHFSGASGPLQFEGADRIGSIDIKQYVGNASHLLGQFNPERNASDRLQINESMILWLTGSVPTDGSPEPKKCGIESIQRLLGVDCDMAVIVVNVVGISLFVAVMLVCLFIVKKRYDRKVRVTRARMEELGLLPPDTSWLCLDQWEVSREHVVLNRKLGEGAFGTVYGGEALINDLWVAVAVKTLKIGSNPEEKLDFLSEAEMMKRFEHKNIVRLLGVCTRGEPAYTIMEFMLHGDLKTFLLSRRQLVGQTNKEAEDISPLALTQMALDVARGLQYLASLKYVHRDLACRNCLVHAGKAVKIGDFGMTRPMYDSDYYRFNKRGMFPVRWMAPESLSDGLFATPSDVWSYGVLLYEIMTFGSFPYQGLSNRQVLNYVKSGNVITLPTGCPPKVQQLLKSCWDFDSKVRPSVDYLIDVLEQSPELVVPCLDAPSTSVALEGPGTLNMNLIPRMRHRNQYQKTPGGEHIIRRGLSLSSHDGDTKLSGDQSPGAGALSHDPFGLLKAPTGRTSCGKDGNSFGSDVPANSSGDASQKLFGRLSFNSFSRLSTLSRSISADERLGACHWSARARGLTGGAGAGALSSLHGGRNVAPAFGTDQDRFATEPRRAAIQRANEPPVSLGSRADSDYCSQHSKDFPNIGCVPFVS